MLTCRGFDLQLLPGARPGSHHVNAPVGSIAFG